ncbi:MAG: hypothetical protein ACI381_00440 [Candidatus Methanomethylophilaceae archaeon]
MKGSTNAMRGSADVVQSKSSISILDTTIQNSTDSQPGLMSAADHQQMTADHATLSTTVSRVSTCESDIAGKQNKLTFDAVPTEGSSNPVTSGGIYAVINNMSILPKRFEGSWREFLSSLNSVTGSVEVEKTGLNYSYVATIPFIRYWVDREYIYLSYHGLSYKHTSASTYMPVLCTYLMPNELICDLGSFSSSDITDGIYQHTISFQIRMDLLDSNDVYYILQGNISFSFPASIGTQNADVSISIIGLFSSASINTNIIDDANVTRAPYIYI